MRRFAWLGASDIPPACDLRRCGWQLLDPRDDADCVVLAKGGELTRSTLPERERTVLLGIGCSAERGRLLAHGYGDVLGAGAALGEVAARAARLAARLRMLPLRREVGRLRLDLLARDGFVGGRPLALHPREFALLWRLADTPGIPVCKRTLVREVWRLGHVPDTNSLAVHVYRLRAKLAAAGLGGLVATALAGGYLLAVPGDQPGRSPSTPIKSDLPFPDLIIGTAEDRGGDLGMSP